MTHPLADASAHEEKPRWVLANRQLRPGVELADTSVFDDDRWDLAPAVLQHHWPTVTLYFDTVRPRFRHQAKELCMAILSGSLPPGERRLSVLTIRTAFKNVCQFLNWVDDLPDDRPHRPKPHKLAELNEGYLEDYHRHIATMAAGQAGARGAVQLLWRYRTVMSDPLLVNPRSIDGWSQRSRTTAENTTDRIPEPVLGPLLAWALRFVDDFATDILAADASWRRYRSSVANGRVGRNDGIGADLERYLATAIGRGEPLPGRNGELNLQFISTEVGCHYRSLQRYAPQLAEAVDQLGISDHTWLPITITGRIDDRPWVSGIALEHPSQSLSQLARLLQTSCYVVIAFLSGMRDSEMKHLQRGCVTELRSADGEPYRWRMAGRAFKAQQDPSGTAATWVVGHPAARAAQVLGRLHAADRPLLFSHLEHSNAVGPTKNSPNRAQTTKCTNKRFKELVSWINDYCATHGRPDDIPPVNGKPWTLSTRQFRRTLAWFIARQPGGSIAGAIQYRHLGIQMFEGYAGTSASGFRAEVESEKALARGERLLPLTDAHQHPLAGPAAQEATRRLDELGRTARFEGIATTDSHRLKRLMNRNDPEIYPGTYVNCVFDPSKALCLKKGTRAQTPNLTDCQPLDCANVALTEDNTAALRREADKIDTQLERPDHLPPLLRARLVRRRYRIQAFLEGASPTS